MGSTKLSCRMKHERLEQYKTGEASELEIGESSTARVPNLWGLMPGDLKWSWCNNNRNRVHNECNSLESSQNHPLPSPQSMEKLSSTKPVPGAKKAGNCCVHRFPCWEDLMQLHAHTSLTHGLGINPVKTLALMLSHHYLQKMLNMCEAGSVDQNIKISKVRPQTRKQISKGVSEQLVIQWFLKLFNHFRNIKDAGEGRRW